MTILLAAILIPVTTVYGQSKGAIINTSQVSSGLVGISYQPTQEQKTKVMIAKGQERYTYDLKANGNYPLQLGNGDYQVSVLENIADTQYKVIKTKNITLEKDHANAVYLQSIDMINWSENMKPIKIAKELTKNATSNQEKATIIYDYVTSKIKYDHNKAVKVTSGYIPNIEETLNTSLGICFDYSVLYAAMMRSVNVPTKLIMGMNKDMTDYHAWNEVYLEESKQWVIIDTTYDASAAEQGIMVSMVKNANDYTVQKIY